MESTATVRSPEVVVKPSSTTSKTTKPVAPNMPTAKAPSCRGPKQLRTEWEALQKHLSRDGELALDMSAVGELQRPAIAQIIRFLQRAEARKTRILMTNVAPKAHAMLEVLGIHHLVEIKGRESQR